MNSLYRAVQPFSKKSRVSFRKRNEGVIVTPNLLENLFASCAVEAIESTMEFVEIPNPLLLALTCIVHQILSNIGHRGQNDGIFTQ